MVGPKLTRAAPAQTDPPIPAPGSLLDLDRVSVGGNLEMNTGAPALIAATVVWDRCRRRLPER